MVNIIQRIKTGAYKIEVFKMSAFLPVKQHKGESFCIFAFLIFSE